MRTYTDLSEVQNEKFSYCQLAFSTGVRVNFQSKDDYITLIPLNLGGKIVVVEIAKSEEEKIRNLADEEYVLKSVIMNFNYCAEILELEKNFRSFNETQFIVGLFQKKQNSEVIFENNFGIIESVDYNEYTLVKISPRFLPRKFPENVVLSSTVKDAKEGIRQVLLIHRWFGSGTYDNLLNLEIKDRKLASELISWSDLIKNVGDNFTNYKGLSIYYQQLVEFEKSTFFNPFSVKEYCKLLLLLGGDRIESRDDINF